MVHSHLLFEQICFSFLELCHPKNFQLTLKFDQLQYLNLIATQLLLLLCHLNRVERRRVLLVIPADFYNGVRVSGLNHL